MIKALLFQGSSYSLVLEHLKYLHSVAEVNPADFFFKLNNTTRPLSFLGISR